MRSRYILVLLLAPLWAHAQKGPHEVYASYGLGTPLSFEFDLGWGGSSTGTVQKSVSGPAGVGYRYFLSEKFALGAQASYTRVRREFTTQPPSTTDNTSTDVGYALLVRSEVYYVRKPTFKVYSGLGVGWNWENHTSSDYPSRQESHPTLHLTLAGIRFGDRVAGFAELGLSVNGILQAGVAVRP
ncbi:outer membrane beta-barrel protein [Hymenobacter guriensis]|uniref:Outer membrane beta-barrel protein n=1 Tax=Hymenobacter guriensis TaxID=2793065 RepID=A0ABS0L611_9BACT|nr:outer membrane beta-barrel protein [Hymenobacter guriensis]MBG8555516.1 outer membrane beta-barrel protein [Hymenobacter guriensis]